VTTTGLTITAAGTGGDGQITLALYGADPGPPAPAPVTTFFDLRIGAGSSFTTVQLSVCGPNTPDILLWLIDGTWQTTIPALAADQRLAA